MHITCSSCTIYYRAALSFFLGITAQLLPQNAFYLEHFSRCKSTVSSQEIGNLFIFYTRHQYFIELWSSLSVSSLHPVVLTISYYTLIRLPNFLSMTNVYENLQNFLPRSNGCKFVWDNDSQELFKFSKAMKELNSPLDYV